MEGTPWLELIGSDFDRVAEMDGFTPCEREALAQALTVRDGYMAELLGRYDRMTALLPPWALSSELSDVLLRQIAEGSNEVRAKIFSSFVDQERRELLYEAFDELMAIITKRLALRAFPAQIVELFSDL